MPAIFDLPEVRSRVQFLSVEAYEALAGMGFISERAELIRGVVIEKMSKYSKPEPDVMIVRGPESDHLGKDPFTAELVVEVVVSSATLDREMASLYAEAGVKEYWIVLANEKQIEVYRQPQDGIYQYKRTYSATDTLVCESVPGLQAVMAGWLD